MNLDELRLIAATIIERRRQGVIINPEQWALLLDNAQIKHFKRKLGIPESYTPGQQYPAQAYEITKRLSVDMSVFKVHMGRPNESQFYISSVGEATLPPDFFYPSSIIYNMILPGGEMRPKIVEILTDEEYADYVSSLIIEQDKEYPICSIQNGYIRFAPKNLRFVEFMYLRRPLKPVYAYTVTAGVTVYDPVHSRELEWDELNQLDILHILLSDLGVVIGSGDIYGYAEKIKEKGL